MNINAILPRNSGNTEWMNGFSAAIRWISSPQESPKDPEDEFKEKVVAAIHDTIRELYKTDPEKIYIQTRKRETVWIRSLSWVTFQKMTAATQEQTANAFRNSHQRVTFMHMKELVEEICSTYPEYKKKAELFQRRVLDKLLMQEMRFTDLGLPSGTLWAQKNLSGQTSIEFMNKYLPEIMPDINHGMEIIEYCTWEWNPVKGGMTVTGPNKNHIFLPAEGFTTENGHLLKNIYGCYGLINPDSDPNKYIQFLRKGNHHNIAATSNTRMKLSLRPVKKQKRNA